MCCRYGWWESIVSLRKFAVALLVVFLHVLGAQGLQLLVRIGLCDCLFTRELGRMLRSIILRHAWPIPCTTWFGMTAARIISEVLSNSWIEGDWISKAFNIHNRIMFRQELWCCAFILMRWLILEGFMNCQIDSDLVSWNRVILGIKSY